MSEDPGYRSGGTAGGRCGCAAAALPMVLLAPIWFLVTTLGNCAPEDACRRNQGWDTLVMLATLAALGALLGFSIRALVNWLVRRVRDPGGAGWPPFWAIAGLLAAAASLDWLIGGWAVTD
jgi:hypothetical protein